MPGNWKKETAPTSSTTRMARLAYSLDELMAWFG
jgi:hypothetical protein